MESSAEPRSLQGRKLALMAIIVGVFAAVSLPGCPGATPVGSGGDGGGNQEVPPTSPVRAEIISLTTGFPMSALDPPVSIFYSVPESATNVRGFYIEVADGSLNSAPIPGREPVISTTDLKVGVHQVFSFDPQEAGVGYFRVGIMFNLDGVEDDAKSQSVIQVQGSPAPVFIKPLQSLTQVAQGTDVDISFDCRDPEGIVQWRLFYLSETDPRGYPADKLGTGLATGLRNVGMFTLPTDDLAPGDYQLGVSATDSGDSVASTAGKGESGRIVTVLTPVLKVVEADQAKPPTITITAPGATNVTIPSGGPFTIRFIGAVNEPGAAGTIEVFYDSNNDVSDGFATIAADLPVSTTSVLFPTGVPEGTYFIGATILDGINADVTVYAAGKLIVTP